MAAASTLPQLRAQRVTFVQLSDAEAKQVEQDAAILKAVERGVLEDVLALGFKGDDLNVADESRETTVHKATRCGDTAVLKYLIDSGAYVAFPDKDGAEPIAAAIRANNVEAMKILLSVKKPDGIRLIDLSQTIRLNDHTLLHEAAWYNRVECAKVLLETGEFTEQMGKVNKKGHTAMHVASFRGTPEFIQLLVEHGASIDATTTNPRCLKESPMQIAKAMGKPANAKHLQELNAAITSLRFAARMRKKRSQVSVPAPVVRVRFDYDLKLFTADLEKSFLVRLARHAGAEPVMMHVLSRTAGSVILEIQIRADNASEVVAKVVDTGLGELSHVVGYPVLSCTCVKGTPDYNPLAVISQSPAGSRPAIKAA